jgi:hypothetical protein
VGKASSTKKVARAAKAGGRTRVRSTQGLVFPIAFAVILLVGLLLVVYARRSGRDVAGANSNVAPVVFQDHFHAAYGVYVCDKFLAPFTNQNEQVDGASLGIHTHGDGIIHIHPFASSAAGKNAKLGVFFKALSVKIDGGKWSLPEGLGTYTDGADCKGSPAHWKAAVWDDAKGTAAPKIYVTDFANIRFTKNSMAITLAFVPDSVDLSTLKPTSIPTLDNLNDLTTAPVPTGTATTVDGATATTVDGASTTVASDSSTTALPAGATTVAPSTATTASAPTTTKP